MKSNNFITLMMVLGLQFSLSGQWIPPNTFTEDIIKVTPREKIYVHINSTLFFPGEYILYKIYTLNSSSETVKSISKVANVELISETGEQIFFQKVPLENGMGSADFFVPTSISSGSYKLVVYTNWMKNFENSFYVQDIRAINPYRTQQETSSKTSDTLSFLQRPQLLKPYSEPALSLVMEKKTYGNREEIPVEIASNTTRMFKGRVSLSVRKINEIPSSERITAEKSKFSFGEPVDSNKFYLPEVRGELITGHITSTEENEKSIKGKKLALSLPDENVLPLIVSADDEGRFFLNLDTKRNEEDAILEILGKGKESFDIHLQAQEALNIGKWNFPKFSLHPEMKDEILKRSISNQIENAYFEVKPDTLVSLATDTSYHQWEMIKYDLDEYTRFKTVPETFVEIINSAWITQNKDGEKVFEVRGLGNSIQMQQLPMVLVDGVLLQDHSALIDFPSHKIKTIIIIRDKLFRGPQIFQGAVIVNTVDGDFENYHRSLYSERVGLKRPEIEKNYFFQDYSENHTNSRVPDFRYQLLWMPEVNLEQGGISVEFFSSDIDGEFEVVLEGFSDEGDPVSVRTVFTVQ